jgi:Pyrimidine dimer DNA glycosylase
VQTFLPYEEFVDSARSLDMKRLGKQRVEAWQIWLALSGGKSGWKNHPAVKMWRGHEWWLLLYAIEVCVEWISRGYNDTLLPKFVAAIESIPIGDYPLWLGDKRVHTSHRANLIRKLPNHYKAHGWSEDPLTGYYWPAG